MQRKPQRNRRIGLTLDDRIYSRYARCVGKQIRLKDNSLLRVDTLTQLVNDALDHILPKR